MEMPTVRSDFSSWLAQSRAASLGQRWLLLVIAIGVVLILLDA